ncbi:hypothetical protein R1flu_020868 [Riccia fluitans]|uniref:Uncharacterized protein n=1 Tax=Riccia fluitans TaxID=41844 RepID=A0ABD1ZMQ5_9MARC
MEEKRWGNRRVCPAGHRPPGSTPCTGRQDKGTLADPPGMIRGSAVADVATAARDGPLGVLGRRTLVRPHRIAEPMLGRHSDLFAGHGQNSSQELGCGVRPNEATPVGIAGDSGRNDFGCPGEDSGGHNTGFPGKAPGGISDSERASNRYGDQHPNNDSGRALEKSQQEKEAVDKQLWEVAIQLECAQRELEKVRTKVDLKAAFADLDAISQQLDEEHERNNKLQA